MATDRDMDEIHTRLDDAKRFLARDLPTDTGYIHAASFARQYVEDVEALLENVCPTEETSWETSQEALEYRYYAEQGEIE